MTNDVAACWVEINYREKDWLACATVAPASCSVSITYISSWCWLTSTYLNILIWFSIEVLHHAFHLQKKRLPLKLLHSRKFLPNSAGSHWLLRGHMTSNNETVSRQNLWAGNVAKSMTSESNSARLPANVVLTDDCSCSEVLWIFSCKISPQATLRFSGHKINCFPRDQSMFKCLLLWSRRLPRSRKQESSLRMKENPLATELLLTFSQPFLTLSLYELTRSCLYVILNKVAFQVIKEATSSYLLSF